MEELSFLEKIMYMVSGGLSLVLIKHFLTLIMNRVNGRDRLLKYCAIIKRSSNNMTVVEDLLHSNEGVRSIIVRGVDAAYIAMKGKTPAVVQLNLRREYGIIPFISGLSSLNDPEKMHDLATGKRTISDAEKAYFRKINIDIHRMNSRTWFRLTDGRDITDEKIDEAMLEQVKMLAKSKEKELSQSGGCHIAMKWQNEHGTSDIVVLPTSFYFRRVFAKMYGTDDLSVFNKNVKDLFEKLLIARRHIYEKARGSYTQ